MIKTIKLNKEQSITLSNNAGWLYEYRTQFGHDITPDLLPIISAIARMIGKFSGENVSDVIKALDDETMQDVLIELAGAQLVDFINVVWALAKAADDDIDEPKEWIRQFETFPLDKLVPEVGTMVLEGFVTEKNLKSLRKVGAVKKSTLNSSQ